MLTSSQFCKDQQEWFPGWAADGNISQSEQSLWK
jgi:hypothetical protein